jgi:hypothetical protein
LDDALLKLSDGAQIITLGAGFDTRWHRLYQQLSTVIRYREIDLPQVVRRKQRILGGTTPSQDSRYKMIAADLTSFNDSLIERLELQHDKPTVVIAECCFMYLSPATIKSILTIFEETLSSVSVIIYDSLFLKNDPFSTQMYENFCRRGIILEPCWISSLDDLGTLWSNWRTDSLMTMQDCESLLLSKDDRLALGRKAMLDEYEEWKLMSSHYYFAHLSI